MLARSSVHALIEDGYALWLDGSVIRKNNRHDARLLAWRFPIAIIAWIRITNASAIAVLVAVEAIG